MSARTGPRARAAAVIVASLAPGSALRAQLAPTAPAATPTAMPARERSLEAGGYAHGVSDGYGSWSGAYLRATQAIGARTQLAADLLTQRAFGDAGRYVGLSVRHALSARTFVVVAGGTGTGRFALPQTRADLLVGHAFGARRPLVLALGAGWVDAQARYEDRAGVAQLAWYASPTTIAEVSARANVSRPGDVRSLRVAPALTRLLNGGRQALTLRADVGTEGYQLLAGPVPIARDFRSELLSATLRHRATARWGASLQGEGYHNPYYTRAGVRAGILRFW
jgi:YaiO family outer membrane protein